MRTPTAALSLLLALPSVSAAFQVRVEPADPRPGDVIRVEVVGIDNPSRAVCRFRSRTYPLYPVGPGRMRALIGLTAKAETGWAAVTVKRRRFLLPGDSRDVGVTIGDRSFTHQHIRMPVSKTRLTSKPGAREGTLRVRDAIGTRSPAQRWRGAFLRPAAGRRSSSYGHTRTINRTMKWPWHMGMDIAAGEGAQVLAPNAGTVVLTGVFPVQGGTLVLDHGQGLTSAFLHLHRFDAKPGEAVQKGQPIAGVGGGGFSTGSHLHWGVYVHGAPVDPEPLLERGL